MIGPSTHTYLDIDPGVSPKVTEVDGAELEELRAVVLAEDWKESGWTDDPPHRFGLRIDGQLAAAANLNIWDGTARDIGVLVAPGHRGRGLGAVVGGSAASHAITRHGLARWSARTSNVASLGGAARLGFEPWATQLAMR